MPKDLFSGHLALGITLGISAVIFGSLLMNITMFLSNELVASAVGAILGGAISTITSFIVQRESNKFSLNQAVVLQTSAKRAGALRAMLLLSAAVAEAKSLRDQIQNSIDRARSEDPDLTELWQTVGIIFGVGHDQQELNQEDLVFLIEMKEFDFLSDVFLMNRRCIMMFRAFHEYARIRRDAIANIPTISDGGLLSAEISVEAARLFDKHAVEMNTMLMEIIEILDQISSDGPNLVHEFGRKAQSFFSDPAFPLVKIVENPEPGR